MVDNPREALFQGSGRISPARQGESVFGDIIFAETPIAGVGLSGSGNIVFEPVRAIDRSASPQ